MVNNMRELFTSVVVFGFLLGWMDIGFGPQYTWWNLIAYVGNL